MAALSIQVPYPVFYDRDGQPLDNGNIYIGVANLDPVTNPLQVYYDEALTIAASQPLRTSSGYVYRNGTPTQLYVNATDFSITVNDDKNLFVYSFPEGTGIGASAGSIEYDPPFAGAVTSGYTVQDKLSQAVSVKDFGATGDGVTDDTTALTTAINFGISQQREVYFPAGTYMCNLDLTADNASSNKISWVGEPNLSILKAFDITKDTVKWNISNFLLRISFKGLTFSASTGTTNNAWFGDAIHYSYFHQCTFTGGYIAHRGRCFGNTFDDCNFYGGSFGYVGIGNADSYAGWHSFINGCEFRGTKVAYFVDNLNAPNGAGSGNIHDRSDWETVVGLSVFIRNQGVDRTELWRNTWFEANAGSGTVDVSGLPAPSGSLGTLTIPPSGIIIHSGTTASTGTYKISRLQVEGGFEGADVLGDCYIEADRVSRAIRPLIGTPDANIVANSRLFDVFNPSVEDGVSEAVTQRLDYFNGVPTGAGYVAQTIGALGEAKGRLDFNANILNRFVSSNIDAPGLAGLVFSGAGSATVVTTQGGVLGRCYKITLNAGEQVNLSGTINVPFALATAIVGYTAPSGFSFAILADVATSIVLDLRIISDVGGVNQTTKGYLRATNVWKTYNFFNTQQACAPAIKNSSGSAVSFYLTDLQATDGGGSGVARVQLHNRVVNFITQPLLAGALAGGGKLTP